MGDICQFIDKLRHAWSPEVLAYCKWTDSTKTNTFFNISCVFYHSHSFCTPHLSTFPFVVSLLSKFECTHPELWRQTSTQVSSAPRALSLLSQGQPYPVTCSRPHNVLLPWQLWLISLATLQGQPHKKGTYSHCTVSQGWMLFWKQLLILSYVRSSHVNRILVRIELSLIYGHIISAWVTGTKYLSEAVKVNYLIIHWQMRCQHMTNIFIPMSTGRLAMATHGQGICLMSTDSYWI